MQGFPTALGIRSGARMLPEDREMGSGDSSARRGRIRGRPEPSAGQRAGVRGRGLAHDQDPADLHQAGGDLGGDGRSGEAPRRHHLEPLSPGPGPGHGLGPVLEDLDPTLETQLRQGLPEPGAAPLPALDEDTPRAVGHAHGRGPGPGSPPPVPRSAKFCGARPSAASDRSREALRVGDVGLDRARGRGSRLASLLQDLAADPRVRRAIGRARRGLTPGR